MVGKTILHYRIVKKLGEGGMGKVYLAKDTKLNRKVALKFLPEFVSKDTSVRERFRNEARAAGSLNHINITQIHAFEDSDEGSFIVMEYVEGAELKELIKESELSLNKKEDIALQIARALMAAHQKGVIHRDVKSSNVMIRDDGVVKVMDFGLARITGETHITRTGRTLGSPAYMAPEQINGKKIDERTDIWSYGILLYELFTGTLPFENDYESGLFYSILNKEPPSLQKACPKLPVSYISIVSSCLQKKPEKRFNGFNQIIEILEDSEAQRSSSHVHSWIPNQKSLYLFIGVAMMLLIVFLTQTYLSDYFNENIQPPTEEQPASVAVLPFKDFSEEGNQQWFSDGLTEEIINYLSKLPELTVTARTSSFIFQSSNLPIRIIADSLNVNHIVEGSVRRSEDQMRISVQLIRAEDSKNLWSETYDQEVDSVFKVQQVIAEDIASALNVYLDNEKRNLMFAYGTRNAKAYDAYLRGVKQWAEAHDPVKPSLLWEANKWLEKAYQQDPTFAAPYYYHHDAYAHYLFEG
ncbi:MAG: serine/threonine-protein kinase, partial [Balneolaceae bacterium]|nr:serine/threonine-protein kinase [Balneolaceae bacterium]